MCTCLQLTKSLGSLYTESTGGCLVSLAGVDKIVLLPLSFTVHSLLIAYITNQWHTEMERKWKLEIEIGNA